MAIQETSLAPPIPQEGETAERAQWLYYLWEKVIGRRTYTATVDVASVAANTTAEQTFSVPGLTTDDLVFVNKPSHDLGLGIVNTRVSAADTLAITYMNATGSAIDPASETYDILAIKKDLL